MRRWFQTERTTRMKGLSEHSSFPCEGNIQEARLPEMKEVKDKEVRAGQRVGKR